MRIIISLIFLLITTSSFALTFDGKFIQGSFILGKTEPGSEVFIDKKKVKVTSDGFFVFGLGRDRKNDVVITINKEKIVSLLNKTRQTIPLLTNEKYLETKTKTTINELTNRIKQLTVDFPKDSYPPTLSEEEENKRIEALKKQLGWGATGMEVPPLPETKRGLKFHTAAEELSSISDEFFEMRNHNSEYSRQLKEINDEIKEYKNGLDDSQELETKYIKEIHKLGRRIEYEVFFLLKL